VASPNREYKDFSLDFTEHPVTGDVLKLSGDSAVRRSVKQLILTNNYERPFQPDLGSSIVQYLFENVTPITGELIKRAIDGVIRKYEPRAEIVRIDVEVDPDKNGYQASITFFVLNGIEPITVDVFLERAR
jgi:phage baseplate assembly protein W